MTGRDARRASATAAHRVAAASPGRRRRTAVPTRAAGAAVVTAVALAARLAAESPVTSIVLIGALVALAGAVGARRVAGQPVLRRRGWWLVGLSIGLFAITSALRIGDVSPASTTGARPLLLAANCAALVGLLMLERHRAPARALGSGVESSVVAGCAAYIGWVLSSVTGAPTDRVALALLALNAACTWLAARLLWIGPDRPLALRLLCAGWATRLAANLVAFAIAAAGRPPAGHGLAWLQLCVVTLWTFAVMHPSVAEAPTTAHAREVGDVSARGAVLGSSMLMVFAVVGLQVLSGSHGRADMALVGGGVLPVAVALHMSYQLFEHSRSEHRGRHDGLTGLPNRTFLAEKLHVAIANASATGAPFALLVLDLDRFKKFNDSLGHADGSLLLQAVGERVRGQLRDTDVLARVGGDEFALILDDIDESCAEVVAAAVVECFAEPFVVNGRRVFASASVGLALFPSGGGTADALLKHADTAMHEAKARGRNRFECYRPAMSARATVKLALESNLHTAIETGQLTLHFQPQVSMDDGRMVGLEALARWQHPQLGHVPPTVFIPLAEEAGLISSLGAWAVDAACRQIAEWRARGLPVVPVAVNVSAKQIANGDLGDLIERALVSSGVPGHLLEIEITESVLVDDFAQVCRFLARLQQLGVRTAIDDFGTGYSGLRYLVQMPIDTLKIDGSFVRDLGSDGGDKGIVGAIVGLADGLGLDVVAEGVETPTQAATLAGHGCSRIQGFLVSAARPADEVPDLLEQVRLLRWADASTGTPEVLVSRAAPPFSDPEIAAALEAVCRGDSSRDVDPAVLDAVIAALQPGSDPPRARTRQGYAARLATGTAAAALPFVAGVRWH